jgi:hypothetical protein
VEAEEGARAAAREGLGRRLREAEARGDALAETVEELRAGLERQRVAADLRRAPRAPLPGALDPGAGWNVACEERGGRVAADLRRARQACARGCPCWAGKRACLPGRKRVLRSLPASLAGARGRGAAGPQRGAHARRARARREDLLKREMADLVRRGQAAEARHEDLAGALPEATRPLLRQIAALQARGPLGMRRARALEALRRALRRRRAAGARRVAAGRHACLSVNISQYPAACS